MSDMAQGKQTVVDDEIVNIIRKNDDPVVAAVEIAEEFGLSRQWAYYRLEGLVQEGRISKKKSSSNSVIYWVND